MKWGPTWLNTLPLRVVYVTTPDGQARLLPHLQPGNVGKATQAPVNAILAVDSAFHHQIPRLGINGAHGPTAGRDLAKTSMTDER
jgi:3-hydroxypropanoate dehydrogenase